MFKVFAVAACLAIGAGAATFAEPGFSGPDARNGFALSDVTHTGMTTNRLANNRLAQNRLAQNRLAQNRLAQNRLAQNRLAQNRLAQNRLAQNGLSLETIAYGSTGGGDVTPLVTVIAVTLADGTRLEIPAPL